MDNRTDKTLVGQTQELNDFLRKIDSALKNIEEGEFKDYITGLYNLLKENIEKNSISNNTEISRREAHSLMIMYHALKQKVHNASDFDFLKEFTENLLNTHPWELQNITNRDIVDGKYIIPFGVTSIGKEAFLGCPKLSSVVIPESVTSIGDFAFNHCANLSSVVIPKSVKSIGHFAFTRCISLSSVVIPKSVTTIGNGAFYQCTNLASVLIPESMMTIGKNAFSDCAKLNSVVIPKSVTSIDDYAFTHCISLSSIVIPQSVTTIGDDVFRNCKNLASVEIPQSVTSIGQYAFSGCTSLSSIVIPQSVTSIDQGAFYGCTNLSSIVIPQSVTTIGERAFEGCTNLKTITIDATSTEDYIRILVMLPDDLRSEAKAKPYSKFIEQHLLIKNAFRMSNGFFGGIPAETVAKIASDFAKVSNSNKDIDESEFKDDINNHRKEDGSMF